MRAIDITVNGMSTFRIKDFRISHQPNEHALLTIEGNISDAEIDIIRRLALEDTDILVSAKGEERTWVWCGLIYDMQIQHMPHETYLTLTLISKSVLMDREKKTRTFQQEGTKISEIIKYICAEYNALATLNSSDKNMDGMLVQYQETDWEFLKRLASHLNAQVVVHNQCAEIVMDIGLPIGTQSNSPELMNVAYKTVLQSLRKQLDYTLSEADVETVRFQSRDVLRLTEAVSTNKGIFYLYKIESAFEKEELLISYVGYRERHYQVNVQKNKNIIGASLNGKVHAVSGSKVQVDLDVDEGNALCGNKDFAYATVYSSDSGTGWYCMPEKGDAVRVYFPSDIEKNSYAISSVHLDVTIDDSRSKPEIKSISNAQKKQVVFAPDEILIKNTENMYISLNDNKGIQIVSNLPVCIHSDLNITLDAGENIEINGLSQVVLKQGTGGRSSCENTETTAVVTQDDATTQDATVMLKDGAITVSGVEFRLQENEGV